MTKSRRASLDERVLKTLKRRHEDGIARYLAFHPGKERQPYASLEDVWTDGEDWSNWVAPHEEALGLAPVVVAQIQLDLGKEALDLDQAHFELLIDSVVVELKQTAELPRILIQGIVQPYGATPEGRLIRALAIPWRSIIDLLIRDWSLAYRLPPEKWEELIAVAFDSAGYDEVTLTPRSGDHGRDVIAVKNGVGSVRIIDSVKAFKPDHLVRYDDVRALAGVLLGDSQATKGIVTTTSDFPPEILTDPFLAPLTPYRLELMNGQRLIAVCGCMRPL